MMPPLPSDLRELVLFGIQDIQERLNKLEQMLCLSDEEEENEVQGRTFNSPNEPRTPEGEEERTPQPSTPRPPEDGRVSSQKIFEDIHEQLVYETIEEKLSNLIDIEPEGQNETKEMSITLEKSMTFKFKVHSGTPDLVWTVKDVMNELKDHIAHMKMDRV